MKELTCSFCGRSSKEVAIIPGPDANICVDCVKHANELIDTHTRKEAEVAPLPPTPSPKKDMTLQAGTTRTMKRSPPRR